MRLLRWSVVLLAASALLACMQNRVNTARPVRTALLPSKAGSHRLVVVLPGHGDRLETLRRSGIGEAIQRAWADADVLFTELSERYYTDRIAPQRLHDDVLMPARRRAYTEIWLVGASMGGMGAILYDGMYPGQVDGIVMLAPYTGERAIHDEIRAAGGLPGWRPDTSSIDEREFWARDLWSQLKAWHDEPERARNVWLGYGDNDSLREGMPLVADALPPHHVLVRPGKHAWSTWPPITEDIFHAIDAERSRTAGTR